jgi:hypothetical protein
MSAVFPIARDLPEHVERWWYETTEARDIALIEGSGIIVRQIEGRALEKLRHLSRNRRLRHFVEN